MTDWIELYKRRDWTGLEDWWRHCEEKTAVSAYLAQLEADVPKITARNGMETEVRHVTTKEAPPEWKEAAKTLELGELRASVEGYPEPIPEIWQRERSLITAYMQSLVAAGEVTEGDKALSRASHATKALELLDSTNFCVEVMAEQLDPDGEEPDDREWLIAFAHEILYLGFHAGLHARAALGKEVEKDAVRGEATRLAASKGGKQRSAETAAIQAERLKKIRDLVDAGHSVARASELASAQGLGISKDANKRLFYRQKKKPGETEPSPRKRRDAQAS